MKVCLNDLSPTNINYDIRKLATAVIHVIFNPAQGISELSSVLCGELLPQRSTTDLESPPLMGSQNFERPPVAITICGGYDEATFNSMREACQGISNVPWLHHDWNVHVTQGGPPVGPGYGKAIVERLKAKLKELRDSGKMGEDGIYAY